MPAGDVHPPLHLLLLLLLFRKRVTHAHTKYIKTEKHPGSWTKTFCPSIIDNPREREKKGLYQEYKDRPIKIYGSKLFQPF
jgi:hypothetical protein